MRTAIIDYLKSIGAYVYMGVTGSLIFTCVNGRFFLIEMDKSRKDHDTIMHDVAKAHGGVIMASSVEDVATAIAQDELVCAYNTYFGHLK
jgi:hypothetical protein